MAEALHRIAQVSTACKFKTSGANATREREQKIKESFVHPTSVLWLYFSGILGSVIHDQPRLINARFNGDDHQSAKHQNTVTVSQESRSDEAGPI
jgi:hypothetical protein